MPPVSKKKQKVRDARAEMYRDLLLKAGEAVFSRVGYAKARLQDIASEAGLSLTTFYATFPSKKDLFTALGQARHEELVAELRSIAGNESALPDRALAAAIEATVLFYTSRPELLRVLLRDGRNWAQDESLPRKERESWHAGITQYRTILRRGIECRSFVDQDPALLAMAIAAMLQVYLAHWLEKASSDPEPPIEQLTATCLRALKRPET